MKKAHTIVTALGVLGALLLSPSDGSARDLWDAERGVLEVERAAWSWSFEEEIEDLFLSYNTGRRPTERSWISEASEEAMHGERVAVIGDEVRETVLRLDQDVFAEFEGRRVEIRFWYKPQGTSVTADITWFVGDSSGQLIRGEPSFFVHRMGQLSFQPTGRQRDDGWRELSSGEFDYAMGQSLMPAMLTFRDINGGDGISGQVARDPDARVLVDAITFHDLGPALVPDAACSATTEVMDCGDHGICSFGKCVDAASYLGSAPADDEVRQAYLDRRRFEVEAFNGVRLAQLNSDTFLAAMDDADDANPRVFWPSLARAFNALVDGHGTVPSASTVPEVSPGACAYRGDIDLMLDTQGQPQGEGLLVYEVFEEVGFTLDLRPGDVITSIDGLAPKEFLEALERFVAYGGDPSARDTILMPELLRWAAQTGAPFTVQRCEQPQGCTPQEVTEFTVSTAFHLGEPLWRGEVPSWRFSTKLCDFRFHRLDDATEERTYGFAGYTTIDGSSVILFNGFPRPDTGDGQSGWLVTLSEVLNTSPTKILFDQRWGTGGSPAALTELHELLLRASDPDLFGETIPPSSPEVTLEDREKLRRCSRFCGLYAEFRDTPTTDGPASEARIAYLNGYDVSANDFFAARLAARPGRTRSFGPARTFGAFGFACQLPPHLPGERGVGYQCTDTLFFEAGVDEEAAIFSSGTGVPSDELILQRQSDALLGVDTARAAALQWLGEE